jgi:DNA-binding GntR family transcriptional regulator
VIEMARSRPAPKSDVRWKAVYAGLNQAIVSHRLAPGTKLPEDELASIYAVSRTAVRSALQALAHDCLVKLEPNRGAFVARPSRIEAQEVFDARALIEPRIAALAAQKAKRSDIAQLRRHLKEEAKAIEAGNDSAAIVLSARFHVSVADIAGQSILMEFISDLVSRSSLIISLYWCQRDTTCNSHAHCAVVDAIADRDPALASDLMRKHLSELLTGLDLKRHDARPTSLTEVLS